jgi:hypothetical protein
MTWNAAQLALRKQKVPLHGATATLLLEAFIDEAGRITASKVVSRGLCKEGEFSHWRRALIDRGWIVWSENQSDKGQYTPGKRLLSYLNKEKFHQTEVASVQEIRELEARIDAKKAERKDLDETKVKLEETREKLAKNETELNQTKEELSKTNHLVSKIASAVRKLQDATKPPITKEKLELKIQAESELEEHMKAVN